MTDQNCTTSEDADNNPPSLNSDLPENLSCGGAVMRAIAEIEARAIRTESKDLPSPPSSMINTTEEEVTQEGKTEVTVVDSLYLELAVTKEEDKIPYDLSISSENEVTNDEGKSDKDDNSEGSLHDSMEILEEVATEDHFDNDLPVDCDSESGDEEKDIFEMPPMPDTLVDTNTPPPPPGGQEFIF